MTSRRIATFLLLGLTAAIGLGGDRAVARDEPPGPVGRAVVPFEMLATNHMLVTARINGQGPFRLIFDLGAPITLMSSRAGEKSGLIDAKAPRSILFSIRGEAVIDTLQLGDLTAKDVPAIVLDHPVLKALGEVLGRPLDGILGYTFFARYKTTIDYQASTLSFEPVEFRVRNLIRDLPDKLAGPKVARQVVLAPAGLWGLSLSVPADGLESPGVPIRDVWPGSPAAAAGLRPGDVLTTLDGRWTTSVSDTYAAAAAAPPDREIAVVILRDGREQTLTVRPKPGI
jgi:Aspartyl protease/PDZ domain